ncbi:MAG: Rid family detoxifying hydrolase [Candidatus Omnitrophica bacterium]|nr:Rid family detoxifying hydrolase [Candidatus Omnitrophota bacterium]MDD5487958.1 Rid family detoxifying hydrolase [Candidatus Omnitrophota bacterium]
MDEITKKKVECHDAPAAIGPYSQAVWAGDLCFVSGQIAIDRITGDMGKDDILEQTATVLANISNILISTGLSLADIVKTEVFLRDMGDFADMNGVYERFFSEVEIKPARYVVQAVKLPKNARIEIAATAYKR